ncbi:AMP-binding protein [Thermobifida halotolerans]|uniref:AMP-binding protein n=1 Tax=Thermobifida halotolerans TaxID=483545 RepID=A0A399FX27_9ACTN|nr:AMP-binding protein [Thermobifida halotolerans]UOE18873.1 AMP-binding protein [Thermobifida halotolerans]
MNVSADLEARARRWWSRPAFLEGDHVWTHGEVHDLAARAATVLAGRGVAAGTRVLLALPDGIAWAVAFLATARLGATAVLTNPALPKGDHEFIVADARVTHVVAGEETAERFTGVTVLRGAELVDAARRDSPGPALDVSGDTPLYVQYTSGTTGRPKGAVHRHSDPSFYHAAFGEPRLGLRPEDVTLSISKLFFAYGFGNAFVFPLFSGGSAVLTPERPKPALVAELVERHGVSVLYGVPSAYGNLAAETDPSAFASLRAAVSAGEKLTLPFHERFTGFLGVPVLDQLGSTEAGHAMCANGIDSDTPGTIGRPVRGFELQVRDKAGNRVRDGEEGELWARGPSVMAEYLNRPEETAKTLVDGWLATRDRAVRNPDGTYTHLGRTDDLEMVGGITVSPLEIEHVLGAHPGVKEVAVACVTDGRGASRLRAFVVPEPSSPSPETLATELISRARAELAAFKVPRSVEVVAALPRTATGKIQRFRVRQGTW